MKYSSTTRTAPTPVRAKKSRTAAVAQDTTQVLLQDYEAQPDNDRTLAAWLVRDDKLLLSGLDLDVFTLAGRLGREPVSVLLRLRDEKVQSSLENLDLDFEFCAGSEEEVEFVGLALSGVPLGAALSWCLGRDDRPSASRLHALMSSTDFRPALRMARDLGIWFVQADQMDDLRELEELPIEFAQAALEETLAQFEPPTPGMLMRQIEGGAPVVQPNRWSPIGVAPAHARSRSYKPKSRSRKRKSTSWKPYRKSSGRTRPAYAFA